MPSAGFETAIPVIKRPQTYALDRTATRIGWSNTQNAVIKLATPHTTYLELNSVSFGTRALYDLARTHRINK